MIETSQQSVDSASLARQLQRRAPLLILLFVAAVAFRTCGTVMAPTAPIADAADYHQLAAGLAEGKGYVNTSGQRTAWRPPGYPLFLAFIYRLAGPRVSVATLVQVVIGALTVIALFMFGTVIVEGREALIAAFIAAIYPGLVWLPRLILSENLSLLLLVITLLAAAKYLRTTRIWWLGVVGLVGGINTLVRGGNIIVLFVLCGALFFAALRRRIAPPRRVLSGFLLAGLAFVIVLMPWSLRNYRLFHSFVPVATQEGLTLYGSYWPPQKNGRLIWGTLPGVEDPYVAASRQLGDEASASRYLASVTRQRLLENPGHFFRLIPSKLISLLVPLDWEIFPHAAGQTRSINYGYLLVLPFALLGFVMLIRHPRPSQWLFWVLPVVVLIQAIVFYGSPRFRLPAELIAILLSGIGVSAANAFLKSRVSLLGYKN